MILHYQNIGSKKKKSMDEYYVLDFYQMKSTIKYYLVIHTHTHTHTRFYMLCILYICICIIYYIFIG